MAEKIAVEKKSKVTNNAVKESNGTKASNGSKESLDYDFHKETVKNHVLTNEEMIHAYKAMLLPRFTVPAASSLPCLQFCKQTWLYQFFLRLMLYQAPLCRS